jgi:medium-chain acyl-[acyl-carrier-protein] hydrolase
MRRWIWLPQVKPDANFRLYCLPHAGAGASAFASWISVCPEDIEIAVIQLPGREARMDEEPIRHLPAMARAIGEFISLDDKPFAIFGHSAGGRLAIHVASYLEDIGLHPARVFVSGASMAVQPSVFLHQLNRDHFIRAVEERFGTLPPEITDDPEVWSLFERPLRADLEAYETDDVAPRQLQMPLSVIFGKRDRVIDFGKENNWQAWSAHPIQSVLIDADHFSYRREPQAYLDVIATHLDLPSREASFSHSNGT